MFKKLINKLERYIRYHNMKAIRKARHIKVDSVYGECKLVETRSGFYFKRVIRD